MKSHHMTLGAGLDALVPRQHLVQHVVEIGGCATLPQSMQAVARGGEIGFVGTRAGGGSMIDAGASMSARADPHAQD